MIISDVSVKRPVFTTVVSILLVAFGAISFTRLPLQELPSLDVPIVSINTIYIGASAEVIETRITQVIEAQIGGIEGIDRIASTSRNESSSISIVFKLDRDLDAATGDVRDAVSRLGGRLPQDADTPTVSKMDSDAFAIMWLAMASGSLNQMELGDYYRRYVHDRIAVLEGVAQVMGGEEAIYSMRIWLNRIKLAARSLTVTDVESALRSQNIEIAAGSIETEATQIPLRITRLYSAVEDFRRLVIREGPDGHLIRLSEVADVEVAPQNRRLLFRSNGVNRIGIGIVKQSTANAVDVSRVVWAEMEEIKKTLPPEVTLLMSHDSTVFVDHAIQEVLRTLLLATTLVVLVIFVFLGSIRAALIPAVVVPVCLIATFGILDLFGYTINLMTLLALVLCIGLVVDDSIVVLENVQRRVETGEPPLVASYHGARQVAFAVIATTLVLIAVFSPLIFVQGFVGRVFGSLAVTIVAAVSLSTLLALSLSPMMCSKLLRADKVKRVQAGRIAKFFSRTRAGYVRLLRKVLPHPIIGGGTLVAIVGIIVLLWQLVPKELAPEEDRGVINAQVKGPEGASFDFMVKQMGKVEEGLKSYLENNEAHQILLRVPGGWGPNRAMNSGMIMIILKDWAERDRDGLVIAREISGKLGAIPGIFGFAGMQQGMAGGRGAQIQFVLSGPDYDTVAGWADLIAARAKQNPGLTRVDTDFKPTKPKFDVDIDRERAAALGVSVQAIGDTLQTMMGSRRVTTYMDRGREYDVILQARDEDRQAPSDISNIFVRSSRAFRGPLIPLANLVEINSIADAADRKRWNRLPAVTISANLAAGYSMGEALDYLEQMVAEEIPSGPKIDYNGESRRFKKQGSALMFAFGFALLVVFLVLAAQFESFIHPFVIMLTVPVAIAGALLGLYFIGSSLNLFSQIGLIILIGIAAKNGILIVEFANQLRDQGLEFQEALLTASETRFRPIVMTGVSTSAGSIPLLLATGAGAGSRITIGIVIFLGVLISTVMTLFIVPIFYNLLARGTGSPGRIARMLSDYERQKTIVGTSTSSTPAQ